MRKLKEEDYTCPACYQRVKDCVCAFASTKDMQAEITRLLAIEVAAKKACRKVIGRDSITTWRECLLCGGAGAFFDNVQHLSSCPVLVINPIGDKQ